MACAEGSSRLEAGKDLTLVPLVKLESSADRRCLIRHLMTAAQEIAEAGATDHPERFSAVAARFRDLSYGSPREDAGPVVRLADGEVVLLPDLLAAAWLGHSTTFPTQGIDIEMLDAARQLLLELAWE
jgi:alpha-D-ribose 1-methylphosphonate 5-triphosphate synthase subunit PhnH